MNVKRGLATILGIALVGAFSAPAQAAERPGKTMADITAWLTTASTHAAALETALSHQPLSAPSARPAMEELPGGHDIGPGAQGGGFPASGAQALPIQRKVTPEMTAALDGLEAATRAAKELANGHEYLDPGMEHVLTNTRLLRDNTTRPVDATALSQEISIELFALANNARVLEAEANLKAAETALAKGHADTVRDHLAAAARVLDEAQNKGAYHVEDDLATLRVVLARLEGGAAPRQAMTADSLTELVDDIHEHLADLRGE